METANINHAVIIVITTMMKEKRRWRTRRSTRRCCKSGLKQLNLLPHTDDATDNHYSLLDVSSSSADVRSLAYERC